MTSIWGEKGLRWDEAVILFFAGMMFGTTASKMITKAIEAISIMSNGGF